MKKLRGSVIGFGHVGQQMTRYINRRDDAEIVAVCNRGAAKLEIARKDFGLTRLSHDPADVLAGDIDFVLITSINSVHKDQVCMAAEAGKHIFCEKPIALTVHDCEAMVDAVESRGLVNVVNYSLRYIPAYIKLKELVDDGTLGEVLSLWHLRTRGYALSSTRECPPHPAVLHPEESGGWTIHHACHGIDLLYWIAGPVISVYGVTRTTADNEDSEEIVWGLLNFRTGPTGMIGDSKCMIREHHTGIIGTEGTAILTGEGDDTRLRVRMEGSEEDEVIPTIDRKREGGGLDHFLDCIKNNKQSPVCLRESMHSIEVAVSLRESARSGRVITLGYRLKESRQRLKSSKPMPDQRKTNDQTKDEK